MKYGQKFERNLDPAESRKWCTDLKLFQMRIYNMRCSKGNPEALTTLACLRIAKVTEVKHSN